jgi:hypothetical protein
MKLKYCDAKRIRQEDRNCECLIFGRFWIRFLVQWLPKLSFYDDVSPSSNGKVANLDIGHDR